MWQRILRPESLALLGFGVFVWYEFFGPAAAASSSTVSSAPSAANALGVPTAPINASTLSPAQLGSGLFENESGLQTSPGSVYASE
jgi:hypothetical protein